ncbi:FliM/FliN family flagellar motor C-terminal domain-containing protein [Massilia niastensis]|uniref:FliM/FliN family flagellar motor C-terminal domain-containing protein n=1 Tax=Massilia niastensis TaxID=544911 RepID=UPI0003A1BC77|nr:FliM/FliN family flagellar motor C-terminal domain-containing protein [Massilia niastensis]
MNPPDRSRDFQVLDPCLLGRPVHLLPRFAARLAEALGAAMASPAGRRYWGAWRLVSLAFERAPEQGGLRWLGVGGAYGNAAVAFERRLLLALLEGRYGRRTSVQAPPRDPVFERVTATEERLAATLTQQLAALLDARVAAGLAAAGAPAVAPAGAPAGVAPASAPGKAGWVIRAVLRAPGGDAAVNADSQLWIGLDHDLMAHVLQGLMADKGSVRGVRARSEPLASSLTVKLDGRLLSKEITLATLFDLAVGDVIPVSVGRADVLLDESRLFTASVAEHKGKLCLTCFEDAE